MQPGEGIESLILSMESGHVAFLVLMCSSIHGFQPGMLSGASMCGGFIPEFLHKLLVWMITPRVEFSL